MITSDDILFDLQSVVELILKDSTDLSDAAVAKLSSDVRERFRAHWGGQSIYFKKTKDVKPRDKSIYEKFDGTNVSNLAREYSLSVQTIYKIIKRERLASSH